MSNDRRDLPGYWAQGEGQHYPEARSPGHAVRRYRAAFGRAEIAVDSGKTVDGLEVPALRREVAELAGEVRRLTGAHLAALHEVARLTSALADYATAGEDSAYDSDGAEIVVYDQTADLARRVLGMDGRAKEEGVPS